MICNGHVHPAMQAQQFGTSLRIHEYTSNMKGSHVQCM